MCLCCTVLQNKVYTYIRNYQFFRVWGCWYLVLWDPQKGSLHSIRFPLVALVCRKTFPVGCVQDTGNSATFFSRSAHVRNFLNVHVSRVHYSHMRHLCLCQRDRGDPLYISDVIGIFYVLQKQSRFHLTWHRPRTDPRQSEPRRVFQIPAKFHTDRHLGEKRTTVHRNHHWGPWTAAVDIAVTPVCI